MYRIKSPKGGQNYWVPILANPDIVEHYSENVVDTLHKKNLLLLGEDRYLSTLMLRTFPKRKQIFVPQAVCKTTVPDEFKVLLSQRRRWINSTVHNLMELVLVRDLCGTFCFSMQFVVFVDLVGTLALPAAIAFTIYLSKLKHCMNISPQHANLCDSCGIHQGSYRAYGSASLVLDSSGFDSRLARLSDRVDCQSLLIRWLDVHLPAVAANLEFCTSNICVLEV